MAVEDEDGRYFCEQCTRRYNDRGDCARCKDEPLMDLADESVRHMIAGFDDARWRRRATKFGLLSIAVMFPIAIAGIWIAGAIFEDSVWTKEILFVATIMTAALSGVLSKRFAPPRRLPELTPEEIRAFDAE